MQGRPRSQGHVQLSSMERASNEQVSIVIHYSSAVFAGELTDNRRLTSMFCIPKILPNDQTWTKSSSGGEDIYSSLAARISNVGYLYTWR